MARCRSCPRHEEPERRSDAHFEDARRENVLDKTARREPYAPEELDYFFIIDGDAAVYLIPSGALEGRSEINVGPYRDFIVGDASSLFATAP